MASTFWKSRSVLVTGGSGLLGAWLVPALAGRGAEVVALERNRSRRRSESLCEWPESVAWVRGSVTDYDQMRRLISDYRIETVFHLAGQTLVGVANEDPAGTLDVNVRGTWNILEASRVTRKCQVLVASSVKAYGPNGGGPITEDHALRGCHPYDVSKSCSDLISTMYAAAYGLPTAIVRCANLFGGGDMNFSRSVPGVILATLRGEPFVIRGDGKTARDFLYVEDAVEAYLLLAERLAEDAGLRGQPFNFGSGKKLTILEIVELALRTMGRSDLRPIVLGITADAGGEHSLNTEKARQILNWSPRFGIEEGLRNSAGWYREHLMLNQFKRASATAS